MKNHDHQLKILKRFLYFTVMWDPICGDLPSDEVIAATLKKFTAAEIIQKLREPDIVGDFDISENEES